MKSRVSPLGVAILLLAEVWVHPVMALTEWVKLAPKGQWLAEPAQPAMNVVVSGSYAYCAMGTGGLAILDIANPANPQLVATLPTRGVIVGVAVSANYAYLVDGNLWVIDISDRAQPRSIAECSTYGSGNGVAVQGHYVYVTAGIHGLFVFDVSDPSSPQQSALYDTDGFPHALAVSGNIAFVLDGGFGLLLLDVTNPAKPSRVGTLNCGWTQAVAVSGDYAYIVTDYFTGYPNFLVTNISNPAQPRVVGLSHVGLCRGLAISGDYAWLAKEAAGLSIIDISCPTDLRHVVGSHRTNGRTLGLAVLGNYSYLADDRGLSIIEFNEVPAITHVERTGNTVTLRWNDSARGMRLQRTANASSPAWVDLMDTENTNRITLPLNGESEFFQLTHP